jgi:hypothetical protein
MYPSGPWRGFWEQQFWGHQVMRDLVLRFADGQVEGAGIDVVGRFTFQGHYDNAGHVVLVKQYLNRHQVLYTGRYDGEGTIFGEWSIGSIWRGPFALSPERFAVPATERIISISADPLDITADV